MENRRSRRSVILMVLAFSAYLGIACPAEAQPSPQLRGAFLGDVEKHAARDAELGTPLSVGDFKTLFESELAIVQLSVREAHEHYQATYDAARSERPWWRFSNDLVRYQGWIVSAILFVYAIFKTQINTTLTHSLKLIGHAIYRRVAGYQIFWRKGLIRYRRALVRRYQYVEVTFRHGRPLEMQKVYVPLKTVDGSMEQVDARQTMAENRRIMVLGPPGSGKTMLMRRLALDYGVDSHAQLPDHPIPIVLELNRVAGSDKSLEEHFAAILELNSFPNANNFVKEHLNRGKLLLLLDGLDEVSSRQRADVVRKIKDFLDLYYKCPVLITCRTAVYENEFAKDTNATVTVVEFSDQQMQDFLFVWEPEFQSSNKSVEQLFRALRERPRIMEVARNPLMLTMIAFLYSDPRFVLPHSRAEFYEIAVTELLGRHAQLRLNEFKASHKRLVLRQLALLFQDRGDETHEDRRSVPVTEVLLAVVGMLPDLSIDSKLAQPLLDEIVDRSGLLLAIDGGLRYQFAHLSLQEFFSAEAISNDNELLAKFQANPDGWRESVKLWCGLEHDSTNLVRDLYAIDELTAFECSADALMIEEELVSQITDNFFEKLGKVTDDRDLILRAFGAVAADARPRGKRIFDLLEQALASPEERVVRDAAEALSFTNTIQATRTLLNFQSDPAIRSLVLRMGDLAVQQLAVTVENARREAIDVLVSVGTSKAALALVPLLWHDDDQISWGAAEGLVTLTNNPSVENALRSFALSMEQRNADALRWIWTPFDEAADSALPTIMGRIAFLLSQSSYDDVFWQDFDPRIVVPLLVLLGVLQSPPRPNSIEAIRQELAQQKEMSSGRILSASESDQARERQGLRLWRSLPQHADSVLRRRWNGERKVTQQDWESHTRPNSYSYENGWHLQAAMLMHQFIGIVGVTGWIVIVIVNWPMKEVQQFQIVVCSILIVGLGLHIFHIGSEVRKRLYDKRTAEVAGLGPLAIFGSRTSWKKIEGEVAIGSSLAHFVMWGCIFWLVSLVTGWKTAMLLVAFPLAVTVLAIELLSYFGTKRDRARNPLHNVIAEMSNEASTSKIKPLRTQYR